ncbi:Rhodanese-like domain-containing protein [Xylariomycetidae sp. FL2044]|nr:Rhodanese-like domain-containing protein [Xylariomycetidae sp. FL2044]
MPPILSTTALLHVRDRRHSRYTFDSVNIYLRRNYSERSTLHRNCSARSGIMASQQDAAAAAPPWHAAFPAPRTTSVDAVTKEEVLELLKNSSKQAGVDYVIVDLRRNDHEGGTIRTTINLPAQSLYPSIPTLYNMFKAAGVAKVIWFCGSSRGRGTRAAGWFHDYITDRGDPGMKSVILAGGIKGWATAGGEFVAWMDGYDGAVWKGGES